MSTRQFTVTQGSTTSTRTINRTREAGVRTMKSGHEYPSSQFHNSTTNHAPYWSATPTDANDKTEWRLVSTLASDGIDKFAQLSLANEYQVRTGKHRVEFDLTLNSGIIDNGASNLSDRPFVLATRDHDADPTGTAHSNLYEVVEGSNVIDVEVFDDGVKIAGTNFGPAIFLSARPHSTFDVTISNLKVTHEYREVTIDRTAPVIDSDRAGESRPLLSKVVGGAAAAYSLRDLNDKAGRNKVARIRRSDNVEVILYGNGKIENVSSGESSVDLSFSDSIWQQEGSWGYWSMATATTITAYGAPQYVISASRQISGTIKPNQSITVGLNNSSSGTWYIGLASATGTSSIGTNTLISGTAGYTITNTSYTDLVNPRIVFVTTDNNSNLSVTSMTYGAEAGDTFMTNLKDFVNEGGVAYDAFVETWHDQSGNENDATQLAADAQPKIAESGNVLDGAKFLGTDDYLQALSVTEITGPVMSMFVVSKNTSGGATVSLNNETAGNLFMVARDGNNKVQLAIRNTTNRILENIVSVSGSDRLTFAATTGNTDYKVAVNGNAVTAGTDTYGADFELGDLTAVLIGARRPTPSLYDFYTGLVKEVIIFNSDQTANRPAIEANLANQYGITLS